MAAINSTACVSGCIQTAGCTGTMSIRRQPDQSAGKRRRPTDTLKVRFDAAALHQPQSGQLFRLEDGLSVSDLYR